MVLKISDIAKEIDRDGDGKISAEEKAILDTLKEMDVDGDGEIEIGELLSLGNQMNKQEEANKNLKKMVYAIAALAVLFCGLTFAICFAAVEAAKDSRPDESGITLSVLDETVVAQGAVMREADVYDINDFTTPELGDVKSLVLSDDDKVLFYSVTGGTKYPTKTELFTGRGDVVTITDAKVFVTTPAGDQIYTEERSARRRSLLCESGDCASGAVTTSATSYTVRDFQESEAARVERNAASQASFEAKAEDLLLKKDEARAAFEAAEEVQQEAEAKLNVTYHELRELNHEGEQLTRKMEEKDMFVKRVTEGLQEGRDIKAKVHAKEAELASTKRHILDDCGSDCAAKRRRRALLEEYSGEAMDPCQEARYAAELVFFDSYEMRTGNATLVGKGTDGMAEMEREKEAFVEQLTSDEALDEDIDRFTNDCGEGGWRARLAADDAITHDKLLRFSALLKAKAMCLDQKITKYVEDMEVELRQANDEIQEATQYGNEVLAPKVRELQAKLEQQTAQVEESHAALMQKYDALHQAHDAYYHYVDQGEQDYEPFDYEVRAAVYQDYYDARDARDYADNAHLNLVGKKFPANWGWKKLPDDNYSDDYYSVESPGGHHWSTRFHDYADYFAQTNSYTDYQGNVVQWREAVPRYGWQAAPSGPSPGPAPGPGPAGGYYHQSCAAHDECGSADYCDIYSACYTCSMCSYYNDAIDGSCPSKCTEMTEMVDSDDTDYCYTTYYGGSYCTK